MKRILLCLFIISSFKSYSQQVIPDGRYSCLSPVWLTADSLAFIFNNGTYEWYINSSKVSAGSFSFVDGPPGADTLVLIESPSAGCINNGGQNPVKFSYGYVPPLNAHFILSETNQSSANCSVHSPHFPGDYYFEAAVSTGIREIQNGRNIFVYRTANGLCVTVPGFTGPVTCEIFSVDGRLIKKLEKELLAGSTTINLAKAETPQILIAKITLSDGTAAVSRFLNY